MSDYKKIKNFSAADIEKYWNGRLSAAEMHAMEKAAMEDPFLADSLEGYKNTTTPAIDMEKLIEKLDKRVGAMAPVIILKRKKLYWLRVAAAIIIITGLGLLAQQLVFQRSDSQIAKSEKTSGENKQEVVIDNKRANTDSINIVAATTNDTAKFKTEKKDSEKINGTIANSPVTIDTFRNDDRITVDSKGFDEKKDLASNSAPVAANTEKRTEALKESAGFSKELADSFYLNDKKISPDAKAKSSRALIESNKNQGVVLNNVYNYRVIDAQNNPVPFANVMNTADNVGTYTDIKGMFNLVSSDSLLNVQIKSLGYNSANYKLTPSNQNGYLILKEDENARSQILANNRKVVSSSVARKDSAALEEPEVGWGYYNTYVANNIKIPDNISNKNTGVEVELSFDIDKTGQPVNIKVTRSSQCKECDTEAIRLLKEGPKWKRKGKKSKGSVTINVDK